MWLSSQEVASALGVAMALGAVLLRLDSACRTVSSPVRLTDAGNSATVHDRRQRHLGATIEGGGGIGTVGDGGRTAVVPPLTAPLESLLKASIAALRQSAKRLEVAAATSLQQQQQQWQQQARHNGTEATATATATATWLMLQSQVCCMCLRAIEESVPGCTKCIRWASLMSQRMSTV